MLSLRLDALDEKYQSTRPPKRRVRKSLRSHVRAHLRTVRPLDDNAEADRTLAAREDAC